MILNYIHWNADPVMFHLGNIPVRWYSILLGTGFITGYIFVRIIFKKENVDRYILESYGIWIIIGVLIGGRLGHCLFYEFNYYIHNPLEMIKPWTGTLGKDAEFTGFRGFSSHGWIAGLFITLWINSRLKKVPFLWALDRFAIVAVLAGAFVRIGNLMNSEMIGIPANIPWAFVFERVDDVPRHPAQIYESLAYLQTFILVYSYHYRKRNTVLNGTYTGWVLLGVFISRFFIEFIKIDQIPSEAIMQFNLGQKLSIPFILLSLILIFRKQLLNHLQIRKKM